ARELSGSFALLPPTRRRPRERLCQVPDVARYLVLGEPLAAVADEIGRADLGRARLVDEGDVGLHLLAAQLVGNWQHRRFQDPRVRAQDVLDLGRRDVLPGAADDVLPSSEEVEEAALVAAREIAALKPAVAHRLLGRLGAVEVAAHQSRGPDQDLAGLIDVG